MSGLAPVPIEKRLTDTGTRLNKLASKLSENLEGVEAQLQNLAGKVKSFIKFEYGGTSFNLYFSKGEVEMDKGKEWQLVIYDPSARAIPLLSASLDLKIICYPHIPELLEQIHKNQLALIQQIENACVCPKCSKEKPE